MTIKTYLASPCDILNPITSRRDEPLKIQAESMKKAAQIAIFLFLDSPGQHVKLSREDKIDGWTLYNKERLKNQVVVYNSALHSPPRKEI